MHWYMAANERASEVYYEHIIVALKTAAAHTSLEPRLIYSGGENDRLKDFEALGAKVIRHDVPFLPQLKARKRIETPPHFKIEIASGAYLRSSVPLLEESEGFVVYTDVDVMFMNDLDHKQFPEALLATSEFVIGNKDYFNSGVMYINVDKMKKSYDDFVEYLELKEYYFTAYDQGAYNTFYKEDWGFIPEEYNWKPYLGPNPEARVLHFHGPKIWTIRNMIDTGESAGSPAHHIKMFNESAPEYRRLREVFERNLAL